jgi:FkbH-like protein
LKDKYGSCGKIGVALVEIEEECLHIKLLLMSCRVLARGVGSILLTFILRYAKELNKEVIADFKQTDRNRMMYITYKFSNFKETSKKQNRLLFKNDLSYIPHYPPYIKLKLID